MFLISLGVTGYLVIICQIIYTLVFESSCILSSSFFFLTSLSTVLKGFKIIFVGRWLDFRRLFEFVLFVFLLVFIRITSHRVQMRNWKSTTSNFYFSFFVSVHFISLCYDVTTTRGVFFVPFGLPLFFHRHFMPFFLCKLYLIGNFYFYFIVWQ